MTVKYVLATYGRRIYQYLKKVSGCKQKWPARRDARELFAFQAATRGNLRLFLFFSDQEGFYVCIGWKNGEKPCRGTVQSRWLSERGTFADREFRVCRSRLANSQYWIWNWKIFASKPTTFGLSFYAIAHPTFRNLKFNIEKRRNKRASDDCWTTFSK